MYKHLAHLKSSKHQSDKKRAATVTLHLWKHVNVRMCERVLGCLYVSVL